MQVNIPYMDPMGSNDVGFQKVNHEQEGNARLLQGEVQVGVFFFIARGFKGFFTGFLHQMYAETTFAWYT